jgi:glucokinase
MPLENGKAVRRILVYDVGGSHVTAAVCSEDSFTLAGVTHAPLPEPNPKPFSAASFGRLIHALGEAAAKDAGVAMAELAGAGFAFPGPFDYEAGVSKMEHKLPSLFGVDLKAALGTRFGWNPEQFLFRNDADCFLLGEMMVGGAKGYARAVGLTLGTGIGSAFGVNDGSGPVIQTDGPGVPPGGEIWNFPYRDGIVEDYVSTRFLKHQFEAATGMTAEVSTIAKEASRAEPCPDDEPGEWKSDAAKSAASDPHCRARRSFVEFGQHLGEALELAMQSNGGYFAPDVIVAGGGIARASQLFFPAARKAFAGHGRAPAMVVSDLLDEAQLTGAGVHWLTAQGQAGD